MGESQLLFDKKASRIESLLFFITYVIFIFIFIRICRTIAGVVVIGRHYFSRRSFRQFLAAYPPFLHHLLLSPFFLFPISFVIIFFYLIHLLLLLLLLLLFLTFSSFISIMLLLQVAKWCRAGLVAISMRVGDAVSIPRTSHGIVLYHQVGHLDQQET